MEMSMSLFIHAWLPNVLETYASDKMYNDKQQDQYTTWNCICTKIIWKELQMKIDLVIRDLDKTLNSNSTDTSYLLTAIEVMKGLKKELKDYDGNYN
tara:strand:- start:49 stop:339 length:291 start_codon:yes stop_codon:yes gene_type:complete